ncbi:recombination mediator RecR [Mesoplasma coleopterae]|uniref:recombination mediator RecR n=1 Tax=Mesoplasma coleopterae TaxID=324078 RepID=UPI000D03D326|nr:recombination mediator RecR [Mesoplasma coleopterae]AVN62676.1 recombination protein RecR [Mesoplasma coleopterae]AVN63355.1 recombination protein RecR [Mesoplasma coleopterae]
MNKELFEEIISNINKNNGLTKKTSERLVNNLIIDKFALDNFVKQLNLIKENISICSICNYYEIESKCIICSDESRNQNVICVVASQLDVNNIEKINKYKGLYHVLGSEINLNKKKSPSEINFENLLSRIGKNSELILALNATFEGELTTNYIYQLTKNLNINITRIAKGIPMGGSLDYMDETTLESAFKNRKKYEV